VCYFIVLYGCVCHPLINGYDDDDDDDVLDLERRRYSEHKTTSGYRPPTWIMMSVGRGHATSFGIPFPFWNDVSIYCNSEFINTSGCAAMLILTVENMSLIVAL